MQLEEKQLIDALFQKIGQTAAQSGPRDVEAASLINQHVQRLPGATYYLAQAIIIQRQALKQAEARIAQLEQQTGSQGQAGPSFLPRQQAPPQLAPQMAPQHVGAQQRRVSQSGGFLTGAAQTALGIGGGILIANAATSLIDGLFGGGYSANDLFDAYDAGYEESVIDDAVYEAGYEGALSDVGDDLLGEDFFGSADFLGDDSGWDDEW